MSIVEQRPAVKSIAHSFDPQVNTSTGAAFLDLDLQTARLMEHLHRGGRFRMVWTPNGGPDSNKKRSAYYEADRPFRFPNAWRSGKNAYFGVHPLAVQREYFQAAHNEDVSAINALFAEIDGKDFTNPSQAEIDQQFAALKNDPAKAKVSAKALLNEAVDKAKEAKFNQDQAKYTALAKAHVEGLAPAPSVVWFSGGGYQAVWLLANTYAIASDADRQLAKDIQAQWVAYVGGDPGAKDLRRVLRIPGTYNVKRRYAPNYPLVTFTHYDLKLTYTLDQLVAVLPEPEPQPERKAPARRVPQATPTTAAAQADADSPIAQFNATHDIREMLLSYGYIDCGDRLSRPGETDSRGVLISAATNTSFHFSSNDPLFSEHQRTPFDVFCTYEHNGNNTAALMALGIDRRRPLLNAEVTDKATGEIVKLGDLTEFIRGEIARRRLPDTREQAALAILQIFEREGTSEAPISDRLLAGYAAVTHKTANQCLKGGLIVKKIKDSEGKVIRRETIGRKPDGLDQWLVTRIAQGNGILADVYRLSDQMWEAFRNRPQEPVKEDVNYRAVLASVERSMVDDAFIRNQVKRKKFKRKPQVMSQEESAKHFDQMVAAGRTTEQTEDQAKDAYRLHRLSKKVQHGTRAKIERLDRLATLMNGAADEDAKKIKSFTTTGLRVIAHLEQANGLPMVELAHRMGKHVATIAAACERMARRQVQETGIRPLVRIVTFNQSGFPERRVFLYQNWAQRLNELRPMLHTDGLLKARLIRYANDRITRIDKILPTVINKEKQALYIEIQERTRKLISIVEGRSVRDSLTLLHEAETRRADQLDFARWFTDRLASQEHAKKSPQGSTALAMPCGDFFAQPCNTGVAPSWNDPDRVEARKAAGLRAQQAIEDSIKTLQGAAALADHQRERLGRYGY